MKIVTIVGARPQFVKAAIVSRSLAASSGVKEVMVHTGQHYDENMSQIFLEEMGIPPIDYQLNVGSNQHGRQTGEMLEKIEQVLISEKPDWLLVYGDTNSTLAGALAAAKLHIPIAHVEAGLRSYNRRMPEEINRIVTDQLASALFTPTRQAVENLFKEGYPQSRIIEVGDVMFDAAIYYGDVADKKSTVLSRLQVKKNGYVLATIHRAENTDHPERLLKIFSEFETMAEKQSVILPLHPRTRKSLMNLDPDRFKRSKIQMIEPVGFLDMAVLEKNAAVIVTDSGGVQKEAFFYQVPCVTLRDETEWVETVDLGWNRLVSLKRDGEIVESVSEAAGSMGMQGEFPYGTGQAADNVAAWFMERV